MFEELVRRSDFSKITSFRTFVKVKRESIINFVISEKGSAFRTFVKVKREIIIITCPNVDGHARHWIRVKIVDVCRQ